MTSAVPDMQIDRLPPEMLLDPSHPANDSYLQGLQKIKDTIVRHSGYMRPDHVKVVKMRHQGLATADIAENVNLTPNTIRRIASTPKAQTLAALLQHLSLAIDGTHEAQRRNFLWDIAIDNKKQDPRVAISAVGEINKMVAQDKAIELGGIAGGTINITINADLMPRTVLDD